MGAESFVVALLAVAGLLVFGTGFAAGYVTRSIVSRRRRLRGWQ